jgi:integrase
MEEEERKPRSEFGRIVLKGKSWWLRWRIGGEEHWENLKTADREKAIGRAGKVQKRVEDGDQPTSNVRKTTFGDLETLLLNRAKTDGRRSIKRMEFGLAHLRESFGGVRAIAITDARVEAYEQMRLETASRATTNYELALLRRMLRLGVKKKKLAQMPATISFPNPNNARQGFLAADDFAAVVEHLPGYLRNPIRFAHLTGQRLKSDVLTLTWDRVDLAAGTLRVISKKTGKVIDLPYRKLGALAAVIEEQAAAKARLEKATGEIQRFVFTHAGKPIRSCRHAWAVAIDKAAHGGVAAKKGEPRAVVRPELVGALIHDLRRTGARNLRRAGVTEAVVMEIGGWRTRSMFERYNIVDSKDLEDAFSKLEKFQPAYDAPQSAQNAPESTQGENRGNLPVRLVSADK